jgi:hypothetical protein
MRFQIKFDKTSTWPRRLWFLGWGIMILISLALFLIADMPVNEDVIILVAFISLIVLALLLLGVTLIVIGARHLFRQTWAILLMLGLLFSAFAVIGLETQPATTITITSRLVLMGQVWAVGIIVGFGIALALYLYYQDKSVPIFAATVLATSWLLLFYIIRFGSGGLLAKLASLSAINEMPHLYALFCLFGWVVVIAPFSFLWHTLIVARREWIGLETD